MLLAKAVKEERLNTDDFILNEIIDIVIDTKIDSKIRCVTDYLKRRLFSNRGG